MKAKVIATGEIIDFKGSSINFGTATWIDSNNILHQESIPKGGIELLENTEPIDWEQRRYEIAKEAMGAFIAGPSYQFCVNNNYYEASLARPWAVAEEAVAEEAVEYAEALIEELRKDKQG